MSRTGLALLLVLATSLLVTGCSSTSSKKDDSQSAARVEDRSTGGADAAGADAAAGARTQGLDDEAGVSAMALDDPDGPLSVRIIYFDYDSSNIREEFRDVVAAHASYLASNPATSVTLEGHADERGSREYNLALGERRALAVRRQLVLLGASAGQVRTVSYGEERPVVDGHDESSYAQNRRVELVY